MLKSALPMHLHYKNTVSPIDRGVIHFETAPCDQKERHPQVAAQACGRWEAEHIPVHHGLKRMQRLDSGWKTTRRTTLK